MAPNVAAMIVLYPHPVLKTPAVPRPVDAAMRAVAEALLAAARERSAYGLAAAHIGHDEPMVVVSVGDPQQRDYRVFYNPEVLSTSGNPVAGREGSVSLPDIEVEVLRAPKATIAFDDANGQRQKLALEGFPARVAQHEIDQMNGIFFLDRVSRLKRDTALRRFTKMSRQGQAG